MAEDAAAPAPTDEVRYEVVDGVARLTINRPERRNALSWTVVGELRRRVAECRDDPEARVLVLSGAGDKAFCVRSGRHGRGRGYLDLHDARGDPAQLFQSWALGKPTIARVRGSPRGGMGLVVVHLVVAAEDAVRHA
jgi:enoyl-CoA hydratase/carnithine racemase